MGKADRDLRRIADHYQTAEWLACWTQAQKGLGSNRSRNAVRVTVLGKLFTSIVLLAAARLRVARITAGSLPHGL